MSLIGNAEYVSELGEIGHEHFIVLTNRGIKAISLIVEAMDANNNPVNLPSDTTYAIDVSNTSYDQPREGDIWSYYNVVLKKEDWIHLRDIRLPSTSTSCDNSWTEYNTGTEGSILHFKYVRFWIDAVPNMKFRLTASSR